MFRQHLERRKRTSAGRASRAECGRDRSAPRTVALKLRLGAERHPAGAAQRSMVGPPQLDLINVAPRLSTMPVTARLVIAPQHRRAHARLRANANGPELQSLLRIRSASR
jgi:hypothetical protein